MLVTGAVKAPALRAMLEEPVGPGSPASLLRDHPRLTVICDREAASLLTRRPEWSSDRVLVVLGHREPGISAEHRISAESRARLRHASRLARTFPIRAVVLTGYTSTGGLSEAEQMKTAWDEHQAPALLEVAGRDTAENASRSLPILLALGEARHVIVISSAWHLRVPWFFAPYRDFGFERPYRPSFAHGSWPRMLANELRDARRARPCDAPRWPRCIHRRIRWRHDHAAPPMEREPPAGVVVGAWSAFRRGVCICRPDLLSSSGKDRQPRSSPALPARWHPLPQSRAASTMSVMPQLAHQCALPIDVLAERRATTRDALYKTFHDARRKLRPRLTQDRLAIEGQAA